MNEGNFPGFSAGRPVELYLPEIIHEETLQANGAFDIQGIPLIYDKFEIEIRLKSSAAIAEDICAIFFNNDVALTNYSGEQHSVSNSSNGGSRNDNPYLDVLGNAAAARDFSSIYVNIIAPQSAAAGRDAIIFSAGRSSAIAHRTVRAGINWESTAPITRIQIRTDNHPTDLFVAGSSVRLIGWRRFRLQP